MTKNWLEPGQTRLGNLYDGDPGTPQPHATLTLDDGRPVVTVFWDGHDDPVGRWFMGHVRFGDDPDRVRYRYDVPPLLSFRDQRGGVCFVRCRGGDSTQDLVSSMGQGRIHPMFTVFEQVGTEATYEEPHGVRTSVSGLREWVGLTSVHKGAPQLEDGLVSKLTFTLESPDALEIPDTEGLCLVLRWQTAADTPDVTSLHDRMFVESWYAKPRTWEHHIGLHRAVRDLLSVSRWRAEQITDLYARATPRADERLGDKHWARTASPVVLPPPDRTTRRHLISFDDLGTEGIATWVRMREEFARAIDPVVSTLYTRTTVESQVSQVGIGMEALGY